MSTRESQTDRARRVIAEDERRVRAEIALGRRSSGLSRRELGLACGISASAESRIERGHTRRIDRELLACLAAAVGLELRMRAYPGGDAIRDAGQQRLLERLRRELHPSLRWRTEVPLPISGDLRSWDAVIVGRGWWVGVEAETVLVDLQAVERRLELKRRDGGPDHVVLLVSDTPRNRRALVATPAFAALPARARDILGALRAGRPLRDGIVML